MRYIHTDLTQFAQQLLSAAGADHGKAQAVAEILVEGDLMGHTTHGLALLPSYLAELASGAMRATGSPTVVSEFPAAVTWDGQRLPGPWLVLEAMALASQRAATQGTCTVVIRRSHHIACLAAYHQRATDKGLMMILSCSDANSASVAPFGGLDPVFTPNPISAGIPTSGTPVVMDISCSSTTNGLTNRLHAEGKKLPADWVIDDHGKASNDPAAFSGLPAFTRQTDKVAELCHASRPAQARVPVRTPGERGFDLAGAQKRSGVALYASIMPALLPWASKLGVEAPISIA